MEQDKQEVRSETSMDSPAKAWMPIACDHQGSGKRSYLPVASPASEFQCEGSVLQF